ncbi:MAG TPA: GatB/YqeY domain-containing protein [Thermoanaerobaculia bacterium]|nr:GatB/YqeY domain-containing protein [Thermoanaerobaculia bacterium]
MTPQQRIESDLKAAMKAQDRERTSSLRLLLADLKNERIKRGAEIDEAGFTAVLRRAIKQREEAAQLYRAGGRPELADKEDREAGILGAYLPQQASETDLRAAAEELVRAQGLSGPAGFGPAMKAMLARFGSAADGATINKIVREILAK